MSDRDDPGFDHTPVLSGRVVEVFAPVPAGLLVDATVGGGGHAQSLLEARDDLQLLGIDRDGDALTAAARRLESFGSRVTLRRARFDSLKSELVGVGVVDGVAGVLFDLGVSSHQLERSDRGFAYANDGPLDMRMDQRQELTAAEVVNGYDEGDLASLIRRYGDERQARRVAGAIVRARPVRTTSELAEIVRNAIPAPARRRGGHPAKRTFQAIRIEVNAELEALEDALDQALSALVERGRCAALAYHSGEDRIVKQRFLHATGEDVTPPPGMPVHEEARPFRLVNRRAWRPAPEEVAANRRSESARMRAVERLASTTHDHDRERVLVP